MNVINKDIDVVAIMQKDGKIAPMKLKITDDLGEERKVDIKGYMLKDINKQMDDIVHTYKCKVITNQMEKIIELKFYQYQNKWKLYKM